MSAPLCPTAIVGLMTLTLGRVGDAFEIFHTVQRGATGHKDYGKGVARCPDGSIAVVGGTKWALPGETPSSSADSDDMFIVKYSAAYEVLWTVQRGTSGTDMAMSIACNPTVTLTFKFMSTIMIRMRTPTHGPCQHPLPLLCRLVITDQSIFDPRALVLRWCTRAPPHAPPHVVVLVPTPAGWELHRRGSDQPGHAWPASHRWPGHLRHEAQCGR